MLSYLLLCYCWLLILYASWGTHNRPLECHFSNSTNVVWQLEKQLKMDNNHVILVEMQTCLEGKGDLVTFLWPFCWQGKGLRDHPHSCYETRVLYKMLARVTLSAGSWKLSLHFPGNPWNEWSTNSSDQVEVKDHPHPVFHAYLTWWFLCPVHFNKAAR